jgi:hypothetical protein
MPAGWIPIQRGVKCYRPRSGTQSIERIVNVYPEISKPGAKTPVTLYGTPGLRLWTSVGTGPIRGIHFAWGYFWIVSGQKLYAVNASTKAAKTIGDIAGVAPVRMTHDATYVVVCAEVYSYAATLTSITTLPEQNLIGVAYQDGYALFVQRNTQFLWISGLDDLSTIPATAFTSADAKSDNVVSVLSDQREVWVFKESTIEVFYNAGASFPFLRAGGGFIERGCASPGSVAAAETLVFWLGDDKKVYSASGYQATAISTPDIDRLISEAYSPETSEAFTYAQAGHTFYQITFADLTLCYDLTTQIWHERRSYGLDRWRAQCHASLRDLHIVGNYDGPEIYELALDCYDEDGDHLVVELIDPPLSTDPRPLTVHEMYLDAEMGVGLTSGQGSAPVALLSHSDDDGRTYGNDIEVGMGALGHYRYRANVNRLGRSYNRSYRWRISDPVKRAILGGAARIEVAA